MRIGELAAATGVSVRSLRYYEEQRLLAPGRTAAGQRVFVAQDVVVVARIQELFAAGFCSSVVRDLLPALGAPEQDPARLRAAFGAAVARLEGERAAVDAEIAALRSLAARLGVAPDTRVRVHGGPHDAPAAAPPAPTDHRDRRLR
ncbi:MerR family transcriptional regulator [Cellulomonas sp. FA1]|uniref:MerR family transcriptional regulator n=1 Tax=Cellulomonas sp. FA1 TaxID=1346710 RepID=UPI00069A1750|nr:MerR family transcriptional regulator [Cellulomonas sp. FA1]